MSLVPALAGMLILSVGGAPGAGARSPMAGGQPIAWLVVGGGSEPSSNQVSLEQDVDLAARTFVGPGVVLFAGGRDALGVQVERGGGEAAGVLQQLGMVMDPRDGRGASYRPTTLRPDGPATPETLSDTLLQAVVADGPPLLVYVATHGGRGETERDTSIRLWGGFDFRVGDLAELIESAPGRRQVRFVVTACYSGAFADLAFAGADAADGAPGGDWCGLFATTADETASGCDPNPERRAQGGYGRYFLHALKGQDENGRPIKVADIDYDRDGRVSLLEAHTRARLALRSYDVPITTSERWLRAHAQAPGKEMPVSLPEEDALIRGLSERLGFSSEDGARERYTSVQANLRKAEEQLTAAEYELDDALLDLRVAILERWPVLDDPWHPHFSNSLKSNEDAVRLALTASAEAREVQRLRSVADERSTAYDRLKIEAAALRRLVRAYDTRVLAARLHGTGGAAWVHYRRLLSCERGRP